MSGLNNIFEIAKNSLFAHQTAINVTGQNIANANTEGYTRKTANFMPSVTLLGDQLSLGTGVHINEIQRTRDQYIDNQLNYQKQGMSCWKTMDGKHAILEQIFEEPAETGLSSVMNNFFEAWYELGNNPDNASIRDNVISWGDALAKKFNYLNERLTNLQDEISTEISQTIDEFNKYAGQIAEINEKLAYAPKDGEGYSNLLDERDKLLSNLHEIADITSRENELGQVNLMLNGKVFLQKNQYIAIDSSRLPKDLSHLNWTDGSTTSMPAGGKLGALNQFLTDIIPDNKNKLDELATGIVDAVNTIHKAGYGLDGSTGINFFDESSIDAYSIKINPDLYSNHQKLAASGDGEAGSGANALVMAKLQDEFVMSGNTLTFTSFYADIVSNEGRLKNEASSLVESQELFVNSLYTYQQSISGVSIDEEMTNLIKFQRGYQAAAQIITIADELTETIINMV